MTPGALARLNWQSHMELVAVVTELATRMGVEEELDALRAFKPTTKNAAQAMLRERELVVKVLRATLARMQAEINNEFITPPPGRAAAVQRARAAARSRSEKAA